MDNEYRRKNNCCGWLYYERYKKKKLIAIAFDEYHCIKNWGVFRPYYRLAGTLRELLLDIPFIALSATLTPVGISEVKKGAQLCNPLIIKESIQ